MQILLSLFSGLSDSMSLDGALGMATVEEELRCERERPQNPTDPYAVVVKKDGITVGKSTR